MSGNLEIIKRSELSIHEKEQVFDLWNSEYPANLSYANLNEFDLYLQKLSHLTHFLLIDNESVVGWSLTFNRDNEKWFAIILSEKIHRKGYGRKMVDELKKSEQALSGWVIDQTDVQKMNGQNYLSPLKFYEKCGFTTLHSVRLELDKISAVKIKWVDPNG